MHYAKGKPARAKYRKTTVNLPEILSIALEDFVRAQRETRNPTLDSQSKVLCAALDAYLGEAREREGDVALGVALERVHQDVAALLAETRAQGQLVQVLLEFLFAGQLIVLRQHLPEGVDGGPSLQALASLFRRESASVRALRRNLFASARERAGPLLLSRWAEDQAFAWLLPEAEDG